MDDAFLAHPPITDEGWYFCFVKGTDLGAVAAQIQYFLENDYELHGVPFVLDGMVYQAMYLPAALTYRKSEKRHKESKAYLDQHPEPKLNWLERFLEWISRLGN